MKKTILFLVPFLVLLCFGVGQSFALERFPLVTTEEMAEMLSQREAGEIDFILLSTLDRLESLLDRLGNQ